MYGPPLGLAATLPEDWQSQVLGFRGDGPERPFIELIQEHVRKRGERALMGPVVQQIAEWVTGVDRGDSEVPLPALRELLRTIEQRAGSWAVSSVVTERQRCLSAHPMDFAQELDSCIAEWQALRYLLDRGWIAIPGQRAPGDFDWHLGKCDVLHLEVKQKAALGSAGHRLAWALRGLSLLPRGRAMHGYTWHCRLTESARTGAIEIIADEMKTHLEMVIGAITSELDTGVPWDEPRGIPGTSFLVGAESSGQQRVAALTHGAVPDVSIVAAANAHPGILDTSASQAGGWILPSLGDKERTAVTTVFARLGAANQARLRQCDGLFAFVWWVPADWERASDQEWLRSVCERVTKDLGIAHVAIWPQGYLLAAGNSWVLNASARATFPELEGIRGAAADREK